MKNKQFLPGWLFGLTAWMMLSITLVLGWISAMILLLSELPNDTSFGLMLIAIIVLWPISFLIANRHHSPIVSAAAALMGGVVWGIFTGGMTAIIDKENVLAILFYLVCYSVFCLFFYTINNDDENRIIKAVCAWISSLVVVFLAQYIHSVPNPLNTLECLIYLVFSGSMVVGFEVAWRKPHTWDNAIDFAAEFLVDFIACPLKKLSTMRGN